MKNKATKWFIIWLTTIFIVSMIVSVSAVCYAVANGLSQMDLPYNIKLGVAWIVLIIFCPPLFLIHREAIKESAKAIGIISLVLLIVFVFGMLLAIVQMK